MFLGLSDNSKFILNQIMWSSLIKNNLDKQILNTLVAIQTIYQPYMYFNKSHLHTRHIIMTGLRELCWSCPSGTVTDGEATYGKEAEVCKEGGMFSCNFKE